MEVSQRFRYRFERAVQELQPNEDELAEASGLYETIVGTLSNLPYSLDVISVGSGPRLTALTPLHDLDIVWVVDKDHNEYGEMFKSKAKETLDFLYKEFERLFSNGYPRRQRVSIGLSLGTFTVDVVPVTTKDDYAVPIYDPATPPDRFQGISSRPGSEFRDVFNPGLSAKALCMADEAAGGRLRPLIRLVKRWNRATFIHPVHNFPLELMCLSFEFGSPSWDVFECLPKLFEYLAEECDKTKTRGEVSKFGGSWRWYTKAVSQEEVVNRFKEARAKLQELKSLVKSERFQDAKRGYQTMFGPDFLSFQADAKPWQSAKQGRRSRSITEEDDFSSSQADSSVASEVRILSRFQWFAAPSRFIVLTRRHVCRTLCRHLSA